VKDDRLYLVHIGECIARILRYTAGGRDAFLRDTMVQDAVTRNLQVLAESTQRLSDGLKARRPEVDWRAVAAFRNVVVHDYLGLDVPQIWSIVERDLPPLRQAVEAALQDLGSR
jgi:uncharacterized protein with HEPN domain